MSWETVIGLEVHVQLLTQTKMFCGCSTVYGGQPNSQTCPVCLALPGALPVPNRRAVEFAIRLGLALGCKIRNHTKFDRKNYFYPDLPKGYQISQFDEPICEDGVVTIQVDGVEKKIRVQRIHLEEDAGKSLHADAETTWVDLNRCGTGLLEIVSHPDIRSPREAYEYLTALKTLVTRLEISSGNLEEGSMRCDANLSIRRNGSEQLGTRTEVKNVNSLRYVEKALTAEAVRQIAMVERGESVVQQTLTFDERSGDVKVLRNKEEGRDYRYFPEPDLVRFTVPNEWIDEVRKFVPEWKRIQVKRIETSGINETEAEVFTANPPLGEFFDQVFSLFTAQEPILDIHKFVLWVQGEAQYIFKIRDEAPTSSKLTPAIFVAIYQHLQANRITPATAKELLERMPDETISVDEVIAKEGLAKVSDDQFIAELVQEVIQKFPGQVAEYRSGKTKLFEFLVGQVMKLSRGKADAATARGLLERALEL